MPHPTEIAFAAVKPIDAEPDWVDFEKLSEDAQIDVGVGKSIAGDAIRGADNAGHLMRGIALALAEHYSDEHIERGMASTLRGIRNAFAEQKRKKLIR